MKRTGKAILAHAGRTLAILGLGATVSLAIAGAPAQAAPSVSVTNSVTVPGLVRHSILINVQMTLAEAQTQVNNGARIQVECWGSDMFPLADHMLPSCPRPGFSGTQNYTVANGLTASDTGVRLIIRNFYEKGGELNEDLGFEDEVYVKVRWIDSGGRIVNATSSIATGYF
jgi:hypothetical protein